jgi:hypothetical protein
MTIFNSYVSLPEGMMVKKHNTSLPEKMAGE